MKPSEFTYMSKLLIPSMQTPKNAIKTSVIINTAQGLLGRQDRKVLSSVNSSIIRKSITVR